MKKLCSKTGEQGKIGLRNVRNELNKKLSTLTLVFKPIILLTYITLCDLLPVFIRKKFVIIEKPIASNIIIKRW